MGARPAAPRLEPPNRYGRTVAPVPGEPSRSGRGKSRTTVERTGRLGKQENDRGKEVHSMRVKLLRGDDEATVLLVHPATLEEYARALDTLGRAERRPANGCGVVTTAEQRARWELPDMAASGRARVVGSAQAFALLAGPAEPETAWEPSAGPAAGAAAGPAARPWRLSAHSPPLVRKSTRRWPPSTTPACPPLSARRCGGRSARRSTPGPTRSARRWAGPRRRSRCRGGHPSRKASTRSGCSGRWTTPTARSRRSRRASAT